MIHLPLPSNKHVIKAVAGTDPAAGQECSDSVPVGKSWYLMAVLLTLVQGITQTPQPQLLLDDGNTVFYRGYGASAAQAISTTVAYTFAPGLLLSGLTGTGPNVQASAALPEELMLPAGFRIRTSTVGIGANSDYAAPVYYVAEFG